MDTIYETIAQYLERMYQESDDLTHVDLFSVPQHISLEKLQEWAVVDWPTPLRGFFSLYINHGRSMDILIYLAIYVAFSMYVWLITE